jgi:hypothetical protein
MRDQRDAGGLISFSRGFASDVGSSHGDGAGRVLRATAAMRIAATGKTTAVGAAPGAGRVAMRLA